MEAVRVAKAWRTKDISAIRCLGSGQFPDNVSSSMNLIKTSWNLWSKDVTTSLFTKPMSFKKEGQFEESADGKLVAWINKLGFPFGPKKENWSKVSKQQRANSSFNFLVDSVSVNKIENYIWLNNQSK